MSSTPKLIAVVGGTGNLGSSVARSLHDNSDFKVRVLSRDPTTEKSRALTQDGIEVVKSDNWNTEDLKRALSGCWGIFINIDSDAPNFKERIGPSEQDMGKITVNAAVEAGVKHAVHASLPAATKLTGGKVPLLAFDVPRSLAMPKFKFKFSTNHPPIAQH
ncbi:hypothetical protein NW762_010650 [Fusarium torreyae]|uniref:NmrA-like domain-containing protein n=1 Tax=Fusarium torreyae TaxID=1237075 RepID=A0A9W8RS76_9HYPO|nr:hypothetical protein NW762_010650 [Fusarium torreyae]